MDLPEMPRPGQPIRAEWGRRLIEYLKSLRIVTGPGSGLRSTVTPAGTSIEVVDRPPFPIRITAISGSQYAWVAVRATTGGVWVDLPAPKGEIGPPGKDLAREESGATVTVPQVVLAWRERVSGKLFFAKEDCS